MPTFWADSECAMEGLSEHCRSALEVPLHKMRELGFTEIGFASGVKLSLDPRHLDSGSIRFLDRSRSHFGLVVYTRVHDPASPGAMRETVIVIFTAVFEQHLVACGTASTTFDPPRNDVVIRMPSSDPGVIHERFLKCLDSYHEKP